MPAKRGRGRPTKLSPERGNTIVKALEAGNFVITACLLAGIDDKTYRNWLERGATAGRGPYRQFFLAVAKATSEFEARSVEEIRQAARPFVERKTKVVQYTRTIKGKPVTFTKQTIEETTRRGDWGAIAFLLERRFRDRWSRQVTVGLRDVQDAAREIAQELGLDPDDVIEIEEVAAQIALAAERGGVEPGRLRLLAPGAGAEEMEDDATGESGDARRENGGRGNGNGRKRPPGSNGSENPPPGVV